MKSIFLSCWMFTLMLSGCASSPPADSLNASPGAVPETTILNVEGREKEKLILRQPGASEAGNESEQTAGGKDNKQDSKSSASLCPPGQLMAIKVVSGETGTRTTQECVTPFASRAPSRPVKRAVAVKVRTVKKGTALRKVSQK
ncbi:MAG: hypothetical protein ACU843_09535 [Gammaproteobacteria bacterium]